MKVFFFILIVISIAFCENENEETSLCLSCQNIVSKLNDEQNFDLRQKQCKDSCHKLWPHFNCAFICSRIKSSLDLQHEPCLEIGFCPDPNKKVIQQDEVTRNVSIVFVNFLKTYHLLQKTKNEDLADHNYVPFEENKSTSSVQEFQQLGLQENQQIEKEKVPIKTTDEELREELQNCKREKGRLIKVVFFVNLKKIKVESNFSSLKELNRFEQQTAKLKLQLKDLAHIILNETEPTPTPIEKNFEKDHNQESSEPPPNVPHKEAELWSEEPKPRSFPAINPILVVLAALYEVFTDPILTMVEAYFLHSLWIVSKVGYLWFFLKHLVLLLLCGLALEGDYWILFRTPLNFLFVEHYDNWNPWIFVAMAVELGLRVGNLWHYRSNLKRNLSIHFVAISQNLVTLLMCLTWVDWKLVALFLFHINLCHVLTNFMMEVELFRLPFFRMDLVRAGLNAWRLLTIFSVVLTVRSLSWYLPSNSLIFLLTLHAAITLRQIFHDMEPYINRLIRRLFF